MLDINKYKKLAGKRTDTSLYEQKILDNVRQVDIAYQESISGFEILKNSNRGESVLINNSTPTRIVVDYNRKNQPTGQMITVEDSSLVWCDRGTIETGDYISYENKHFIVNTFVKEDVGFDYFYMQRCNNTITFKDTLGVIRTFNAILTNLTLYSDGLNEKRYFQLPDGKRNLIVQKNKFTSSLKIGYRLIFNNDKNDTFKISHIDNFTIGGIVSFTLTQESHIDKDDLENNIAYNDEINLGVSIRLDVATLMTNINKTYQINPKLYKDNIEISGNFKYESMNTSIVTVNSKGLVSCRATGSTSVRISLIENPSVYNDLVIHIVENQDNYTVEISGASTIKKNSIQEYIANVFNNGNPINEEVIWEVTGDLDKVEIEYTEILKVKCLQSGGSIVIKAKRMNSIEYKEITVSLASLW